MKPVPPGESPLTTLSGEPTYLYPCYLRPPGLVLNPERRKSLLSFFMDDLLDAHPDWGKQAVRDDGEVEKAYRCYRTFLEAGHDGDSITAFDGFPFSPPLSGRAGVVILRDQKVVSLYLTRIS